MERVRKERPEENREEEDKDADEEEEEEEWEERLGRRRTDLRWASMVRHISLLDGFRDDEEKENIWFEGISSSKVLVHSILSWAGSFFWAVGPINVFVSEFLDKYAKIGFLLKREE